MNVVLLRVGIDSGCGGISGPIFANRSFDFVPIDAQKHRKGYTYGTVMGRHKRSLIEYFPGRRQAKMRNCFVHDDPEFKTHTYGDPTGPKQGLKYLRKGDLLVFYAGLCGWGDCITPPALYIVGYFEVKIAGLYPDLISDHSKREIHAEFANNWHIREGDISDRLVLIKGGRGSQLLNKAVRLSARKKKLDRGGHPIFVLDPAHEKHFGRFTRLNAIQRSIPRRVTPEFTKRAAKFVRSLP